MALGIVEMGSPTRNHRLYSVDFFGTDITVTVTSSPNSVRKWVAATLYFHRRYRFVNRLVMGMGVQWTPFTEESDPPADTLQLCVGSRCLIFQLSHSDAVPRILRRVLADEDITFVGIWNSQDAKKLLLSDHELFVRRVVDARVYAGGEADLCGASFETIAEECLGCKGVSLDREISRSNWAVPILSHRQVMQACLDAHVSFEIGRIWRAWEWGR